MKKRKVLKIRQKHLTDVKFRSGAGSHRKSNKAKRKKANQEKFDQNGISKEM